MNEKQRGSKKKTNKSKTARNNTRKPRKKNTIHATTAHNDTSEEVSASYVFINSLILCHNHANLIHIFDLFIVKFVMFSIFVMNYEFC